MRKIKVMTIFGTRPEAIKMAPVINELDSREQIESIVCVTGQHKEMLDSVLRVFNITPHYNLEIMKKNQSLTDVTTNILQKLEPILQRERPDLLLVHGDTSTTFSSALSAFYNGIKIGHIEAGLRTYDNLSPYPEEFNRRSVSAMASIHFAPTRCACDNLLKEKIDKDKIVVTGNTAIDALSTTVNTNYESEILNWSKGSKMVLITAHRRENLGAPMVDMFNGIKKLAVNYPNVKFIYPVHKNPSVVNMANKILFGLNNIKLVEPLDVIDFHNIMKASYFIITDSGGIQEEAPSLGKPVLVMRTTTERPEAVEAGTVKLVGTDSENIFLEGKRLLEDEEYYRSMSSKENPYGKGNASEIIVDFIIDNYYKEF